MRVDKFLKVSRLIKRRTVAKEASEEATEETSEEALEMFPGLPALYTFSASEEADRENLSENFDNLGDFEEGVDCASNEILVNAFICNSPCFFIDRLLSATIYYCNIKRLTKSIILCLLSSFKFIYILIYFYISYARPQYFIFKFRAFASNAF